MADEVRDITIIGGGPSGLFAAFYAGRALRIYPLYFVVFIAYWLALALSASVQAAAAPAVVAVALPRRTEDLLTPCRRGDVGLHRLSRVWRQYIQQDWQVVGYLEARRGEKLVVTQSRTTSQLLF